jgi:para-nitrobenzyl esterase
MKKGCPLLIIVCFFSLCTLLWSCANLPPLSTAETNQSKARPTFDPQTLIAETTHGPVRGGALGEGSLKNPAVYAWIKIPYAAPPLGDLMFKAPRDPETWQTALDCSTYQITVDDYPTQWDWGKSYFSGKKQPIGSPDCLYLNVWRPQTAETGLPVQMDIHGGSSCNWAGLDSNEWQAYVNAANCIVVAPNYRLGPWGNFSHPALKTGDPRDDSGNFAIMDQIKALEWIRDNIAAFGGDPGNVTLSGQSSGGLHASMLLHSPLAKELFDKAIVSSPSFLKPEERIATVEQGNRLGEQIVENLILYADNGIGSIEAARNRVSSMRPEEIAAYLRDVFTNDPLLVFTAVNKGTPHRPSKSDLYRWGFTDGHVVAPAIDWNSAAGHYFPKPMIIGDTEADMYANYPAQEDSGGIEIYNYTYKIIDGGEILYDSYDEAIEKLVPMNTPVPGGWQNHSVADFKAKYDIASDACLRAYDIIGVHDPVRKAAAAPGMAGKVFVYRQDWASYPETTVDNALPFDGFYQFTIGADHSSDLWAMYDWNDIKGPGWFEGWTRKYVFAEDNYRGRKDLSHKVAAYLGAFLRSTDGSIPKTEDMPIVWEPWTLEKEQFMTWNATADSAVLGMNDRAFTGTTLRAYLSGRIDELGEATAQDKEALKKWTNTQISGFGLGK